MVQKNNLIGKRMKLARIAQRMKRQDVLEKIRENGIELYPTGFSNMERPEIRVGRGALRGDGIWIEIRHKLCF